MQFMIHEDFVRQSASSWVSRSFSLYLIVGPSPHLALAASSTGWRAMARSHSLWAHVGHTYDHSSHERRTRMNIYVGNLPRQAKEDDLRPLFESFGKIMAVNVIKDKFSGESKGFGFVEMSKKSEGEAAIEALNGKDFMGQALTVNEARPKSESGGRRTGGGYGGGGHKGGGGGYGGGGRGGRRY